MQNFDGLSDIVMGMIIDKTKTRWGKARPWLLFMGLPLILPVLLVFFVPTAFSEDMKEVYIAVRYVAQCLADLKKEQYEIIEALGSEYQNYNLVMATTFGLPIGDSYLRDQMQRIIDKLGLPDVVFHSLRHTSVTYKLKLSGGDIKAVQGDSGHAQADMVTEVYGHIIDEDRRKNAELMENAFYNKENLNPEMRDQTESSSAVELHEGVDADLLMKVLTNPEMAALLTAVAKTMKV